ncbi:MAG: hypothetical protein LBB49_01565, partial [Gracilibacteraceae bacterium]|nr:hypothetical protein [Gracilibacteraceae bacterium]
MRKIWDLSMANIRMSKGQAAGLLIFVVIAAMLLSLGLLMILRFSDTFDRMVEETHAPHFDVLVEKGIYTQEQTDYLRRYPGVTEVEVADTISFSMVNMDYNKGTMIGEFFFSNADKPTPMNTIAVADGGAPQSEHDIALPLIFKSGGYRIGDDFVLTVGDVEYIWQISGFTTDILHGSTNIQIFQAYVSEAGYG